MHEVARLRKPHLDRQRGVRSRLGIEMELDCPPVRGDLRGGVPTRAYGDAKQRRVVIVTHEYITPILDKRTAGEAFLAWLVGLGRLMGTGGGGTGSLLPPVVQAVQTVQWGEGEVPKSGMT